MPTPIIRADEIFTTAVYAGDLRKVEELLRHGAGSIARCRGEHGTTPLHWAASNNSVEMLKLLIEHGAEPNATARDGCTALHYAAREDCTEAAQVLLQSGARPDLRNNSGNLPADEIYDDTSDEGRSLLRLLTHSTASLPAAPAPDPAPAREPHADRWGSRPLPEPSAPAARSVASAERGGASVQPAAVRGALSIGGGFGGGSDMRSGGILEESADSDVDLPDNCGHEVAGAASGDGEAAASPGSQQRGAVRVALGPDGTLSMADYEAIRRAYVVTGAGGESHPFTGWEQEEAGGGAAGGSTAGPAGPRYASTGTGALSDGIDANGAAGPLAAGNGHHAAGNGNGAAAAAATSGQEPLDAAQEARLASFLNRAMGNMGIGGELGVSIGGGPGSAVSLLGFR